MKKHLRALAQIVGLCAGLILAGIASAYAQNTDTYFYTPNGGGVNGSLGMCLNAQNKAVPCNNSGAQPSPVTDAPYPYTPLTPGQYTPVSDAASTALTVPTGSTYAVLCTENASHRFTWDGTTTPTASVGTLIGQNACMTITGPLVLAAFRIITVSAGGTFTVSYGK